MLWRQNVESQSGNIHTAQEATNVDIIIGHIWIYKMIQCVKYPVHSDNSTRLPCSHYVDNSSQLRMRIAVLPMPALHSRSPPTASLPPHPTSSRSNRLLCTVPSLHGSVAANTHS